MPFDVGDFKLPVETKPDVFSLEGLIAWLEKQNPEAEYDWNNCSGECLLGQYLSAHGSNMGSYSKISDVQVPIYQEWAEVTYGNCPRGFMRVSAIVSRVPHTFGAALDRARALVSK